MDKELNLVELLKYAPIGTKLYSPIFGECELQNVITGVITVQTSLGKAVFNTNGTYYEGCGECLLFPSKENQDWSKFQLSNETFKVGDHIKHKEKNEAYFLRQEVKNGGAFWAVTLNSQIDSCEFYVNFEELGEEYEKVEKFDPKWLEPFDRVIVHSHGCVWFVTFFSHLTACEDFPYAMNNGSYYKHCVPYNEETKYLIGTKKEEPEFYKI